MWESSLAASPAPAGSELEIVGTDGRIILEAPFRADKAGGTIEIKRGDESETESFEEGSPYLAELEEFAAAVREQREPAVGPQEILGNARAIGGLLESARQGGRVQGLLTSLRSTRRPVREFYGPSSFLTCV